MTAEFLINRQKKKKKKTCEEEKTSSQKSYTPIMMNHPLRYTNSSFSLLLAVVVVAAAVVVGVVQGQPGGGGDGGDFNFDSLQKPCPKFKCLGDYTLVPKSRSTTKFTSTGCSSMGAGGTMMMMNAGQANDEDKPYESCCHYWHACYQICGTSKKTCDTNFEQCSVATCEDDNDTDSESCKKDIKMSKMMIDIGGCQKYDQAQYEACECASNTIGPAKVSEKREAALRNFYKKFAPENVNKVPSLIKKADTATKLAGLLMKLVEKYSPKTISIKKDPMHSYFDKLKTETAPPPTNNDDNDNEAHSVDGDDDDDNDEDEEKIEL